MTTTYNISGDLWMNTLADMVSQMEDESLQYRRQGLIPRAGGDQDID